MACVVGFNSHFSALCGIGDIAFDAPAFVVGAAAAEHHAEACDDD